MAVDADDDASFAATAHARLWVAPERYGYKRLHEYYNHLAKIAAGEWLLLWNDDCTMLTPQWDQVIAAQSPAILWPEVDYAPELNSFPVVPAAWARHLGGLGSDQSIDMWIHHVALLAGVMRKIPVQIHHAHIEGDVTADERDAVATTNTFWTPEMEAARRADAAKIRELLG